eukprot:1385978-Amphidinium_carterae.1
MLHGQLVILKHLARAGAGAERSWSLAYYGPGTLNRCNLRTIAVSVGRSNSRCCAHLQMHCAPSLQCFSVTHSSIPLHSSESQASQALMSDSTRRRCLVGQKVLEGSKHDMAEAAIGCVVPDWNGNK